MSCYECEGEGQKVMVAFVAALLIGGLLVWAFTPPPGNTDMKGEAIKACVLQGGIPIEGEYGRLKDCIFKPQTVNN